MTTPTPLSTGHATTHTIETTMANVAVGDLITKAAGVARRIRVTVIGPGVFAYTLGIYGYHENRDDQTPAMMWRGVEGLVPVTIERVCTFVDGCELDGCELDDCANRPENRARQTRTPEEIAESIALAHRLDDYHYTDMPDADSIRDMLAEAVREARA